MSQEKFPKDVQLIKELYEKLEWLTFVADDKEFEADQVDAILTLLDSMDPDGDFDIEGLGMSAREARQAAQKKAPQPDEEEIDVDAAFSRFKKKYKITDQEMAQKTWAEEKTQSSKKNQEISGDISFDSEEFKKKLAEFRKKEAQGRTIAVRSAEVSDLKGSDTGLPAQETSAPPKDIAARQDACAIDSAPAGGAAAAGGSGNATADLPRKKRFRTKAFMRAAATLVVVVAAFGALNVGTKAVGKKSFFEIVRDGVNGMNIVVTGNEEVESVAEGAWESDGVVKTYYDSWEDMEAAVGVDLMQPTYIPDGLELESLFIEEANSNKLCHVQYGSDEGLFITWKLYDGDYYDALYTSYDNWTRIEAPVENVNNADFYKGSNEYEAFLRGERTLIFIVYNNYDELVKISNSMK